MTFLRQMRVLIRLSLVDLWRQHDMIGLLVLTLALMVPLARETPLASGDVSRFLDAAALLLIWAFSLFIALGSGDRLFPPEFEFRAAYTLLARPISHGRLLVGKYLGAVVATWSAVTFFYLILFGSIALRGGTVLTFNVAQAYVLHLAGMAVAVAVSLLFSLFLSHGVALTLCTLAHVEMFLFGRELPHYADAAPAPLAALIKALYAIGPHIEFFDMRPCIVHGEAALDGAVFLGTLGYAAVYITVVLFLANWKFRRLYTL